MKGSLLVDLHTHPQAHGEMVFTKANLEQFVWTAAQQGLRELGFSDHDLYLQSVEKSIIKELQAEYPQIKLRIGLEVDYRPGADWNAVIGDYAYDYLIGSVHEIDRWMFDHPDYMDGYKNWQGDDLYRAYFKLVAEAALSGLFQVMGHLDLIRVFNFPCQSPLLQLALPALEAIKAAGIAIELNTNGRYKPVRDYYPARELLQAAFSMDIPVTLGSDAHVAVNVARDFAPAVRLLKSIGYQSIVSFANREPIQYSLA